LDDFTRRRTFDVDIVNGAKRAYKTMYLNVPNNVMRFGLESGCARTTMKTKGRFTRTVGIGAGKCVFYPAGMNDETRKKGD
jgi:hypothetical protein